MGALADRAPKLRPGPGTPSCPAGGDCVPWVSSVSLSRAGLRWLSPGSFRLLFTLYSALVGVCGHRPPGPRGPGRLAGPCSSAAGENTVSAGGFPVPHGRVRVSVAQRQLPSVFLSHG